MRDNLNLNNVVEDDASDLSSSYDSDEEIDDEWSDKEDSDADEHFDVYAIWFL